MESFIVWYISFFAKSREYSNPKIWSIQLKVNLCDILLPFFAVSKVVHKVESVHRLTHLLRDTPHGGYPVVIRTEIGDEVFCGLITR